MGRLDDKVAVITGAGGGMGREAAILFTGEGARVCVADVNAQAAQETVSLCPGEAFSVEVDVADEEGVADMYAKASQRFGGVDVLYNNAGISPGDDASVLETSVEAWQRVQDVNAFAREGVRVNALCPGPVETPLLLSIYGDDPAALERRRRHWPTGRLAKPREIVNAALFLASDESSYVTGTTFLVDGGLTAAYVTPE